MPDYKKCCKYLLVVLLLLLTSGITVNAQEAGKKIWEDSPVNFVIIIAGPALGVLIAVFIIKDPKKTKKIAVKTAQAGVSAPKIAQNEDKPDEEPQYFSGTKSIFTNRRGEAERESSEYNIEIIEINQNGRETHKIRLKKDGEVRIGRSKRSNDIIIEDKTVSNKQCIVRFDGRSFSVANKSQTNMTKLNEREIGDAYENIPDESVIQIGETELAIRLLQDENIIL